jgi:hexosaminidase
MWRGALCLVALAWLTTGTAFADSPSPLIPLPAEMAPGQGTFTVAGGTVVRVPAGDAEAAGAARYLVEKIARTRGLRLSAQPFDAQANGAAGVDAVSRDAAGDAAAIAEAIATAGNATGGNVATGGAAAIGAAALGAAAVGPSASRAFTSDVSAAPGVAFLREPGMPNDAYRLDVASHGIQIRATSSSGLFYGAVTLWQLIPVGKGAATIPAQTITDAPAYKWRGLMLDSSRHFQSIRFIKSMLDWMAWHKLNTFHWHLTDDQGWRIEIRKYPRLTSVGSCRTPATATKVKPPEYCGFYTQAQIRDIVAYAAERHIQVIPEIEMPGHAQAAIAAYPELGSIGGTPPPVSAKWGVHAYLFNIEPKTIDFLHDVLTEVMELFPSPYIHVGGDEAVKDQWKSSPSVQARAQALGITDPEALQTWFMQEMGKFLEAHGKRLVGWDEILQPGLPSDAVVMSWRGVDGAHAAAVAGNDAVLSPWPTLYFDNRQSTRPSEPPGRMRVISLEDVYRFEPRDATLTADQQKHVLGLQANIWTEHIRTEERVELMTLPRAAAVAEVGWTAPERKDWNGFLQRLVPMAGRYRALGIRYDDSALAPDPHAAQSPRARRNSRELKLCSDGVSLLLEPNAFGAGRRPLFALDIMNPCWIFKDADLSHGAWLTAAVGQLPFNFEIGADVEKIRVGDAKTAEGELEVRVDRCDGPVVSTEPLPTMPAGKLVNKLRKVALSPQPGRHDICLRFARPRLDPMWALDWVEIRP